MDLNKSKTFRAVERICSHYFKLKKVIYEEVKSKDMYITHGEMYKEAEEGELKKRPVISETVIDTLDRYNDNFQSQDGLDLKWKVV